MEKSSLKPIYTLFPNLFFVAPINIKSVHLFVRQKVPIHLCVCVAACPAYRYRKDLFINWGWKRPNIYSKRNISPEKRFFKISKMWLLCKKGNFDEMKFLLSSLFNYNRHDETLLLLLQRKLIWLELLWNTLQWAPGFTTPFIIFRNWRRWVLSWVISICKLDLTGYVVQVCSGRFSKVVYLIRSIVEPIFYNLILQ